MRYHKNLSAEPLRRMPWKQQVGLVLAAVAEDLSIARLDEAPAKASRLYQRLMSLYSA